ncbi:MAG: four helix bundle protein [Nanoarchaeota archaeon]|nr:four helix bundle protein [Nanoarchaeota archaeon]MBU1643589.1 four helix bundle protein [Nanoarchaeota archaeon]MBU1976548.1 four helix bundle protein [Nanoarchaeota archaeon]
MARNYNNIEVYHLAYNLVLDVYKITKEFPSSEEQNITSQVRRASVSIPLNIAEGSAKASNREFVYFLNVAYASAKEVGVLLKLSFDLNYLCEDGYTYLSNRLDEVNAKLFLFLRNVESRLKTNRYHFFKKFED